MNRSLLLQTIREEFATYKNDNRALPRYKGLTEMLDAVVKVLEGYTGPTETDIEALRQQMQQLKDQVEGMDSGLDEQAVQAQIDAALAQWIDQINRLQAKDTEQDNHLQQLKQRVDALPSPANLSNLQNRVNDLTTQVADNQQLDSRQDADIAQLQQTIQDTVDPAELNQLQQTVQGLRDDLDGNTQTDQQQSTAIEQLRQDIQQLPTSSTLTDLQNKVEDLKRTLTANDTLDEQQQTAIEQLQQDLQALPGQQQLDQLQAALDTLREGLVSNTEHDTEQDTLISTLQQQIGQAPGTQDLDALRTQLADLQTQLTTNNERDNGQDSSIAAIEASLQNIPTDDTISGLRDQLNGLDTRLTANDTRDTEQDTAITDLQQAIQDLPTGNQLTELRNSLEELRTELTANTRRDLEQDTAIATIEQSLENLPDADALDALRTQLTDNTARDDAQDQKLTDIQQQLDRLPTPQALDNLEAALDALQAKVEDNASRDDTQDGQIAQIQQDIQTIPTSAALDALREDINTLRTSLSSNVSRDDAQDGRLDQLEQDIQTVPSDAAINSLRNAVLTLRNDLSDNNTRDDDQDTEIQNLKDALGDSGGGSVGDGDLKRLEDALTALENSLATNVGRDDQQDADIQALSERIENIPTEAGLAEIRDRLTANEELDGEQSATIAQIQQDLQQIPTESGLQELRDRLRQLREQLKDGNLQDKEQRKRIGQLENWKAQAIDQLNGLQSQLEQVDTETIKAELLAELQRVETECDQKIAELAGLPQQITDLEQRLDGLQLGISAEEARTISQEVVQALRDSIEERLALLEGQSGDVSSLQSRLDQAETDISRLFELVDKGNNGGGSGQDGVTKAYVQAELRKLEATLRTELSNLSTQYDALATLPSQLQALQQQLANRTTVEQVNTLIATAVSTLIGQPQLDQLKEELREAWEAYVAAKCTDCLTKITEIEQRLNDQVSGLENTLRDLWAQLPDQPLPDNWLQTIIDKATELDNALKADLMAQLQEREAAIRNDMATADTKLENDLWTRIEKTYLNIKVWEDERTALQKELNSQLRKALAELEDRPDETNIRNWITIAIQSLEGSLGERIGLLEGLDIGSQIDQLLEFRTHIQNLDLNTFVTFINNLDLSSTQTIVETLNVWKEGAQGQLDSLQQQLEELTEQVDGYTGSDVGDRLSRICHTGWGPMGGLEVYTDEEHCLHVSPGHCITPNGHAITLKEEATFASYYALDQGDPLLADQGFFADFPVWRLVAAEPSEEEQVALAASSGKQQWLPPQNNRQRDVPFLSDKVVLLLPGPVFLLIRVSDYLNQTQTAAAVKRMMGEASDFEFSDYTYGEAFSPDDDLPDTDAIYRAFHPSWHLADIPLYRFGFKPGEDCTPEELDDTEFPETLASLNDFYQTWKPIVSDALNRINAQVGLLLRDYHELLFPQLPVAPFEDKLEILLSNWSVYTRFAESDEDEVQGIKAYAQYFYDWARDLIRAYHECRDGLQDLLVEVCLHLPEDLKDLRHHLALGPAWQPFQDGLAPPMRDHFHQPLVYNSSARLWEQTRLYYHRIFELIESFHIGSMQISRTEDNYERTIMGPLPDDRLPEKFRQEEDDSFAPDYSRLKITPGKSLGAPLGQQAIPFYYPLTVGNGSLQYYWDYRRAKTRTYDQHRSYHASDVDDSYNNPDDWHVTRPLYFTLEGCDFYRIEGHINKEPNDILPIVSTEGKPPPPSVLAAIEQRITKHNLDCKVIEIKLDGETNLVQAVDAYPELATFRADILGAEHLGGVPRGGTFILIVDTKGRAIADFAVPYRIA